MKRFAMTVLLGALVAGFAGPASAGDNVQAAIALHITPANNGMGCSPAGLTAATVQAETPTLSPGNFYWTYLIVCNGSDSTGIAGLECGIDYPAAVQVYNWALCADLQFPFGGWPASGSSNLLTWITTTNCQIDQSEPGVPRSVIAVGGYFYMGAYAPSQMSIIPRPVSGSAKVADCDSAEDDLTFLVPSHLGVAGFGGAPGYNPCGAPTPVQQSTWSGIKTLINR
jgi:hypothetical protein